MKKAAVVTLLVIAQTGLPGTSAGFLDIESRVRRENVVSMAALVRDVHDIRKDLAASLDAAQAEIDRLNREKAQAEAAVLEKEREIRMQVEQRVLDSLRKELNYLKTFPYRLDTIASAAITSALYENGLEMQPIVYENYVFIEVNPPSLEVAGNREALLRLVLFWKKNDTRVSILYKVLEKRLRSPEPQTSNDPRIKTLADRYVANLASLVTRSALP
jgi:hypothetical protein